MRSTLSLILLALFMTPMAHAKDPSTQEECVSQAKPLAEEKCKTMLKDQKDMQKLCLDMIDTEINTQCGKLFGANACESCTAMCGQAYKDDASNLTDCLKMCTTKSCSAAK
jgi:hypothetical protein